MADAEAQVVPDGNAEEQGNSLFCLEFVSMNASSKAEKQQNRWVVRSTAMKNFRRRQLSQRTHTKEASRTNSEVRPHRSPKWSKEKKIRNKEVGAGHNEQHSDIKEESDQDLQEEPYPVVDEWIFETTSHGSWFERQAASGSHNEGLRDSEALYVESSPSYQILNGFFALPSPLNFLGGGRVDPFRRYPGEHVGTHVHELIDHSTSALWPGLRPRGANGVANQISSAWLERVTSRPLVMHAMLFGGAVHMDVLRNPRAALSNPVRLFHKVQTMRLLKEELKNPDLSDLDELILAVLTLGASEVEKMKPKTQSPFNSPLSSSQWLNVYGSMPKIEAHTLAMRSLVGHRGGLEKIRLEGLAEVLEFSNILGATQTLSKPYWPLLNRTVKVGTSKGNKVMYHPLISLGQAFQTLIVFGITDDAANILQALADLTVVIECFCREIAPVPELSTVIDRRNFVQHALLSLPTADELESDEVGSVHLYEAVRYAALIYSVAVTFPLPPMTGVYDKLTARLKSVLEESKLDLCWKLYPKTLLWVLTLGGIASSVTVHRSWYVRTLSVISAVLNISTWDEVVEEMGQYLWLERACDAGGRKLWLDVIRERHLNKNFEEEDT